MYLNEIPLLSDVKLKITLGANTAEIDTQVFSNLTNVQSLAKPLAVKAIRYKGKILNISGADIVLEYKDEDGMIYRWNICNTSIITKSNVNVYILSSLEDTKPINRRESYRVSFNQHIILHTKSYENPIVGLIGDISNTGIRVILDWYGKDDEYKPRVGDLFKAEFTYQDRTKYVVEFEVVRIEYHKPVRQVYIGCAFKKEYSTISDLLVKIQRDRMKVRN